MPRLMQFFRTFNRFKWDEIEIEDCVGQYVDGEWVELQPLTAPRLIKAIPLTSDAQNLVLAQEGSASFVDLFLITDSVLYFTDINATAQETRQSYALYKGFKYRIIGDSLLPGNVQTLNIYKAQRYVQ